MGGGRGEVGIDEKKKKQVNIYKSPSIEHFMKRLLPCKIQRGRLKIQCQQIVVNCFI